MNVNTGVIEMSELSTFRTAVLLREWDITKVLLRFCSFVSMKEYRSNSLTNSTLLKTKFSLQNQDIVSKCDSNHRKSRVSSNQIIRIYIWLTFTTLLADSAYDKLVSFFLFFLENRIGYFIQIVSLGEVSDPIF